MTEDEVRTALGRAIHEIAPEADLSALAPSSVLRDELDLDSMDFLNVVIALHAAHGVDIPERDYPELRTWGGALAYLGRRLQEQ